MSLAVLGTIIGLERVNRKIPGALIAVVGAIALNYVFDLTARGVTDLGPIPGGLPALGLPTAVMTVSNVGALLPTVVSIVIVILAQSAATSRAYAIKYGDSFEENVDLVGLGLANVGGRHLRHVRGQRQSDEDIDGRQRRRQEPAGDAHDGRGGRHRPAVPDRAAVVHAERGAVRRGLPHRHPAHRRPRA